MVNWRTLGDAVRDCRLEGVAAELLEHFSSFVSLHLRVALVHSAFRQSLKKGTPSVFLYTSSIVYFCQILGSKIRS